MKIAVVIFLQLLSLVVASQEPSKYVLSIVNKEYGEKNVELKSIEPLDDFDTNIVKHIWSLSHSGDIVAFLFEIESKGRMHAFTSMVLLNPEGGVLQVAITNYPSTHGIQVTNRRWLNKLRIDSDSKLEYGDNVDALSGATISANSLIKSIEITRNQLKRLTN